MENNLLNGSTILIVEDDPINYILLKEIIKNFNTKHIWAKDGLEALNILIGHENISLILMDIDMPQMDGITTTRIIRKKKINIPIIFQSAYNSEEKIRQCFTAGGNEFLSKPLDRDKMNLIIKKYLVKN
jgi:CheY-like chemotaxis protein